jgi:hypothetical protein
MAEAFQRAHSDRTTYGYRQLAGAGPGNGPELKTLVFGTIGTALGIVFGTILASGGWSGANSPAMLHGVQAGSVASVSTTVSRTDAPQTATAVQAAPVTAATPPAEVTPAKVSEASYSATVKPSAAQKISVSAVQIPVHTVTARKRHFVRHWRHWSHRVRPNEVASIHAETSMPLQGSKPDESSKAFIFSVEGDASISNYDALTQTIDTYEGESFSLDQSPSATTEVAWQDNVHYRCDQSGNCDLVRAGQAFTNTHRTK